MSTAAVLSERIVLGTMLRGDDPGFTQDTLGRLAPAAFTIPAHRTVYAAIARTADTHTVDLSTVMLTLGDSLTAVGGFEQLSAAVQESFTSTTPVDHVARLADQAALDRRRAALQQALAALDGGQELDTNREFLLDILASTSATSQLLPSIQEQTDLYCALLDQRLAGDVPTGLMTGWSRFDEVTLGLQPGSLVVVAGRAGTGKTVAMMDWARRACRDGHGVIYVPLEMSAEQMVERAVSAESCVELNKLREPGCLDDDQWDRASGAISAISQWPLYIDNRSRTLSDIRRTAIAAKAALAEQGRTLELIVVDYLQLMSSDGGRGSMNRAEEVGRFTRGLKQLARELELVVVAGSQFNRSAADPNKLPRLDELKESGSIEEDSDIVLALHRAHAIDGQIGMSTADEITGLLLKNRHGAAQIQFERAWHGHLASTDEPMRRAMPPIHTV